jgi:toxic protein SymE
MGKRKLKIYEAPGCVMRDIPCIRLQGRWLERLGFKPGNNVIVQEGSGRLVIELVRESDESKDYTISKRKR